MKSTILLLFLAICPTAFGQEIEFLEKKDTLQKPEYQQFIYIDEKTDLSDGIFVAKIKCTAKIDAVSALFFSIKSEAQKLGANAFRVESFNRKNDAYGELILSTYYVQDGFFEENFKNLPQNKIFIFGSQNLLTPKVQGYKVDGEKFEIESGKYQEFEKSPTREIKINKGGITGMTLWISQSQEGYSSFLNFSGIGLNGVGMGGNGSVGIAVNTGTINKIEPNLALALLKIYTKK